MKNYFLFDLDGTLTDTGEGIMKSVAYALEFFGLKPQPTEVLRRFIGPPLHQSFEVFCGLSPEKAMAAVEKYRERYREKGVYENTLYEGMDALLQTLCKEHVLCVATSKPEVFARQILKMRGIDAYFTVIVGANLDGTRTAKAEVIEAVLSQLPKEAAERAVMIGDREHDILGAKACGLRSIGVEYGYAEPGELHAAGADYVVPTVQELERCCLSL